METLQIRHAQLSDIPLIHILAWEIFPQTYREILSKEQSDYMMDWMYSHENLRKQIEEQGHHYYLAYRENKAVGYVSIRQEKENLFHLEKIYVLSAYQKYRIGKALFNHARYEIHRLHPTPCKMELNVNRNNRALGFYLHMGMQIVREGDFPIGNGYYMNDYILSIDIR